MITDTPGFIKDPKTGAIINTNLGEYEAILSKRRQKQQYDAMVGEVAALRGDVTRLFDEIKKLREMLDK